MKKFRIIAKIGGVKCYWGERNERRESLWYTFPTVAHTHPCYQFMLTLTRTRLPSDVNYVNGDKTNYIPVDLFVEEAPDPATSDSKGN